MIIVPSNVSAALPLPTTIPTLVTQNFANTYNAGLSSSFTVTRPAVSSGNLILVFANFAGYLSSPFWGAQSNGFSVAPNSGIERIGGAEELGTIAFWKIATSSEPSTYTFTANGGINNISTSVAVFSNVNQSSPFNATTSNMTSGSQTAWPSVSMTTTSRHYLHLACGATSNVSVNTTSITNNAFTLIGQSTGVQKLALVGRATQNSTSYWDEPRSMTAQPNRISWSASTSSHLWVAAIAASA